MADATGFLMIPQAGHWTVRDFLRILIRGPYKKCSACEGGFLLADVPQTSRNQNHPQIRTFGGRQLGSRRDPDDSLWDISTFHNPVIYGITALRMQPKWDVPISQLHRFIDIVESLGHKVVRTYGFRRNKNHPVKGHSRLENKEVIRKWYRQSKIDRYSQDIIRILSHLVPLELAITITNRVSLRHFNTPTPDLYTPKAYTKNIWF